MTQRYLKHRGIILNSYPYTDADMSVIIFTENMGKIQLTAKGARRPKSRYGPLLMTGNVVTFMAYFKQPTVNGILQEIEPVESFETIRKDYTKLLYLSYYTDLVHKLFQWHDEHREVFIVLYAVLQRLAKLPHEMLELLSRIYEWKLLYISGVVYLPDETESANENMYYDSYENTFIPESEIVNVETVQQVPAAVLHWLQLFSRTDWPKLDTLKIPAHELSFLKTIMHSTLRNFLGYLPKPLEMLYKEVR